MTSIQTSSSEGPTPPAAPARPHEPRARRWAVLASLVSLLVFIGSAVVLYLPWIRNENPSAMIVVTGDATVADLTATVSRPAEPNWEPLKGQFKEGDYQLRFHVPPGRYTITLRHGETGAAWTRESYVDARAPLYVSVGQPTPAANREP